MAWHSYLQIVYYRRIVDKNILSQIKLSQDQSLTKEYLFKNKLNK